MQDGPTYESWVVCLGTHQGFLASVHAEAKHPSQDRKCNPPTIAQASSMHDTSQLQIWWSLLTWKLKNRVVVECREFEAELADMGCVLARGCDSCTHELEFSESELTDIGCVLASGCDSCTYESRF